MLTHASHHSEPLSILAFMCILCLMPWRSRSVYQACPISVRPSRHPLCQCTHAELTGIHMEEECADSTVNRSSSSNFSFFSATTVQVESESSPPSPCVLFDRPRWTCKPRKSRWTRGLLCLLLVIVYVVLAVAVVALAVYFFLEYNFIPIIKRSSGFIRMALQHTED